MPDEVTLKGGPADGKVLKGHHAPAIMDVPVVLNDILMQAEYVAEDDSIMMVLNEYGDVEHPPVFKKAVYQNNRDGTATFEQIELSYTEEHIRQYATAARWSQAKLDAALSTEWPQA